MKNIIQNINKAFDHRIRLGIMSVLMVNEFVDFNTMKEFLGATDGNLASHIKALEADEFITVEKQFIGKNQIPNTALLPLEKSLSGSYCCFRKIIKSEINLFFNRLL